MNLGIGASAHKIKSALVLGVMLTTDPSAIEGEGLPCQAPSWRVQDREWMKGWGLQQQKERGSVSA